jgi:hypothetical protein
VQLTIPNHDAALFDKIAATLHHIMLTDTAIEAPRKSPTVINPKSLTERAEINILPHWIVDTVYSARKLDRASCKAPLCKITDFIPKNIILAVPFILEFRNILITKAILGVMLDNPVLNPLGHRIWRNFFDTRKCSEEFLFFRRHLYDASVPLRGIIFALQPYRSVSDAPRPRGYHPALPSAPKQLKPRRFGSPGLGVAIRPWK